MKKLFLLSLLMGVFFVTQAQIDPFGGDVETEFALFQSITEGCLDNSSADDFPNLEDLYIFIETNCEFGNPFGGGGDDPFGGGNDDPFETDSIQIEIIFAELSAEFPDCLANYTVTDFASVDELFIFVYVSGNCIEGFPEDSLWIGEESTIEDEFAFLQLCFPNCLANYTAADFADVEALYDFVYSDEACIEEAEGYEWEEAELIANELAWMQEIYPDCLANYTAADFETLDELYELVYGVDGCEADFWGEDSTWTEYGVAEGLAFLQSITDGCLDNSTADDFADLDELYVFFETNCDFDAPGEEDGEMPGDLDDWLGDSYPNGPEIDFVFGDDDEVIGVEISNGVSITFDENAVIISIAGLTADNLPADIETYLTENGYIDGVTDVTVTEDEDGNIVIVVTVEVDGGKSSDVITLSFDIDGKLLSSDAVASGINTITDLSIKGYPNPTTDQLFVTAGSAIENIVLINQIGQVVYTANPIATQTRISLETLSTGMYILKVTTEEGVKGMNILKK